MNKRIEKLAEQAMDEMDPESFSEDVHIPTEWYQKFAELIVRECFVKLTPYLDDQFIDDIESELKEHFGVEE